MAQAVKADGSFNQDSGSESTSSARHCERRRCWWWWGGDEEEEEEQEGGATAHKYMVRELCAL
jgi:hypothetical protein